MNFEQFVAQNTDAVQKRELPPLKNTKELALVIIAGTAIYYEMSIGLPKPLFKKYIDGIVAQVEKQINEYIEHHYGAIADADVH